MIPTVPQSFPPEHPAFALAEWTKATRRKLALASLLLTPLVLTCPHGASAAYAALYGSDGNDFVGFTGNSAIAGLKNSGWNGLIMWALTVQSTGDITMSSGAVTLVHNGVYTGPSTWGANVASLKTPPTTVYRYECALGGAGDQSFANIKSLIAAQGTGSTSILYQNFQALKTAVPGIDAINDDDESTYDINSSTSFGQMLNNLGYELALAPYQNQGFWVQLKNNLGAGCDLVYLQCYQGGAGNNVGNWNSAFGNGFRCMPGIESNSNSTAQTFWSQSTSSYQTTGGFYWPDVAWSPSQSWGATQIINAIGLPNITGRKLGCQLANLNSGLLLNAVANGNPSSGDAINQWYSINNNQIWTLNCDVAGATASSAIWSLSYYTGATGLNLTSISQTEYGQYDLAQYTNANSQHFTVTPQAGWPGYYTVKFIDGWLLDDKSSGTADGTPVQESPANGTNAQAWQLRFDPQTGY